MRVPYATSKPVPLLGLAIGVGGQQKAAKRFENEAMDGRAGNRAPAGHVCPFRRRDSVSKPTNRFERPSPFSFRQDGSRTEAAFPVWLAWQASVGHELRRRSIGSKGEIPGGRR